jgi:DNA-binding LytR/AlgR family response regulator
VFLDIQMPGLDGFGALSRAAAAPVPVIVFVTAHERHAVRAFDVDAADYLVKPFNDERFHRAVVRARVEVQRRRLVALVTGTANGESNSAPRRRPGRRCRYQCFAICRMRWNGRSSPRLPSAT